VFAGVEITDEMARQTLFALATLLSLVIGETVRAQSEQAQQAPQPRPERHVVEPFENIPRYGWWKDEKAMAAAGFSAQQAAEIDRIFREHMEKAKPLREEVMQLQKALSETIDANTADIPVVAKQIEKVESRRFELNKIRYVMLYRMQRVLLPEQYKKLMAYFEQREAARKKQGDHRGK
jgi:Spy/CpxP family protein refolding chaperone